MSTSPDHSLLPLRPAPWRRLAAALVLSAFAGTVFAQPSGPQWQGAAFEGDRAALAKLAESGARVIRVYRESDAWVLDAAQELGLKVVMGLWVGHPRHGFRLDNAAAREAQEEGIRRFVLRYRSHPAILAWGVGNEVETGEADPMPAWREVDRLAGLVKKLDPARPTMMVVADTSLDQLKLLADCCANVDLLGINLYAGAVFDLAQRLHSAGITKPVVVSELGALGQWQAGRKPWGAPVELTSREKADFYRKALAALHAEPQVRGVFPFLWGAKQEQTATWHGLLLADGSLTEMTDALAQAWGRPPLHRAPTILGVGISADVFAPGARVSAGVDARSADDERLSTEWTVRAEATDLRLGGDNEAAPARVDVAVLASDSGQFSFMAPNRPGAYRLFITVRGAGGKVATANLPFLVRAAH
ncbi:MAG: hypothetical protein M0P63_07540 [Azoarcus sp.]|nr:hypothetical protein [Azoarcus sp.]